LGSSSFPLSNLSPVITSAPHGEPVRWPSHVCPLGGEEASPDDKQRQGCSMLSERTYESEEGSELQMGGAH
jgi:hypothetical protein